MTTKADLTERVSDIVERLRAWADKSLNHPKLLSEAADEIERLRAPGGGREGRALPRGDGPAPSNWRPIAEAPKDGTHVLVGTFPAAFGQITITTAHWFNGEWALSVNYDGDHSNHGVKAPTHWQPLPGDAA